MPDVRLVDLEVIKKYSVAVRVDAVPADELLAALDASRAVVMKAMGAQPARAGAVSRRPATKTAPARKTPAAKKTPAAAKTAPAGKTPAAKKTATAKTTRAAPSTGSRTGRRG